NFGICGIAHTYLRSKFVDFTDVADFGDNVYISLGPFFKSKKWIILEPFNLELWLLLMVSIVIIWAILRKIFGQSSTFIVTKLYQILLNRGNLSFIDLLANQLIVSGHSHRY